MTRTLDPLAATDAMLGAYRRYLRSTFLPRDPQLRSDLTLQLESGYRLARGPILQSTAPYRPGASVRELVGDGVLHPRMLDLDDAFPTARPLHLHQERAVRKIRDGRNVIVATGTGSGKTEAFLLPIVDRLLREADAGTLEQPGVRALLLYPMNALANDQMKRFRSLLTALPEITFGRYIGETAPTLRDALDRYRAQYRSDPPCNELTDRHSMQERPPHLLLTNYAMLERLLLRLEDSSFFDGDTGRHWRFVVLDEVHVYDGAKGAELAMLLRRVKQRVGRAGHHGLTCVGTSATLGSDADDRARVTTFATALFGEPFEHHDEEARQDLIEPDQLDVLTSAGTWSATAEQVLELRSAFSAFGEAGDSEELARRRPPTAPDPPRGLEPRAFLHALLADESHLAGLQRALRHGSREVDQLAAQVFAEVDDPATRSRALVALIDLVAVARSAPDAAALLPARYHVMLRSLEGAFVCRHPDHPRDLPRLTLTRSERCGACATNGTAARTFEFGVCRRCGTGYAVGARQSEGHLERLVGAGPLDQELTLLALTGSVIDDDDDEDEAALDVKATGGAAPLHLCSGCGALAARLPIGCGCDPRLAEPVVHAAAAKGSDGVVRRCPVCAGRTGGPAVRRISTGAEAPVSVIATALYQQLPPSDDISCGEKPGSGRKLLLFSDSRQDAAFFAPYLDGTYARAVQRHLLWARVKGSGPDLRFEDLVEPLVKDATRANLFGPDTSVRARRNAVETWLFREVVATDLRLSLDGVGLVETTIALPTAVRPPPALVSLDFTAEEALDLVRTLLGTLRLGAAVSCPDGVDIGDPSFAPRNTLTHVRRSDAEPGTLAWLPAPSASNRRLDYVLRVIQRRGLPLDARTLLAQLWDDWLTAPGSGWEAVLPKIQGSRRGVVRHLDHRWTTFIPTGPDHQPRRCDSCGQVAWRSVGDVCASFRCQGRLVEADADPVDHYRQLYTRIEPIALRVEEHTAQLSTETAAARQQDFLEGDINALSCSTTFELGVDVGEVLAVLLRNVPPSAANYVQRTGRAGRRAGSPALAVTFAQRRNHDRQHFDNPFALVDGKVAPPVISLANTAIVRRHVHATALAAFQRHVGRTFRQVQDFFLAEDGVAPAEAFLGWLRSKPAALGCLADIVPPECIDELGVDRWDWARLLEEEDEEGGGAWLTRAAHEVRSDLDELSEEEQRASARGDYRRASALQGVRTTLATRNLLDYLAQKIVLPKYGFPVDVVELNVRRSGDAGAARVELERDLRLAVGEYAPGSKLVADKAIWEPSGVKIPPGKRLVTYTWSECSTCKRFSTRLGDGPPRCCVEPQPVRGGRFVVPMFGFLGKRSEERIGEARPERSGRTESYFDDYAAGVDAPFDEVDLGGVVVASRFSRRGRITVVNAGRGREPFAVCLRCGWAGQAIPRPARSRRTAVATHPRPAGRGDCDGTPSRLGLGHQYLTDVLEVRVPGDAPYEAWYSTLQALLAATPSVGITRGDIDGHLYWWAKGEPPAFVLFDSVPGGAGHARRLGEQLPQLLHRAWEVVRECECAEDTSCYSCLRTYANQWRHDELERGLARDLLEKVAVPTR